MSLKDGWSELEAVLLTEQQKRRCFLVLLAFLGILGSSVPGILLSSKATRKYKVMEKGSKFLFPNPFMRKILVTWL